MATSPGTIAVSPVLFCAPVFWGSDFWAESAHKLDWVESGMPLEEKPSAQLEVLLDVTLGEVFAVACDVWGLIAGPGLLRHGFGREEQFYRFGFVVPERDALGIPVGEARTWPSTLPIAQANGDIEQVPALQITYRELLVASSLGMLEGDIRRPYVDPVRPQGDAGTLIEPTKLTIDAIRAAYAAIDAEVGTAEHTIHLVATSLPAIDRAVGKVIDEGVRIGAVVAFCRWIWRCVRKPRGFDAED